MALTATAHSALPREPAWDEVIVPALRKRLKDESNALAKRISAASITSLEEQAGQYYAAQRPGTSTSSHSYSYSNGSKPSAIPRPSLQSSRTADSSSGTHAAARPAQYSRARTLSQPFPVEPPHSTEHSSPPSETRPISPLNAPKGTRIPVSRTRTGSTSSQAHSVYNGSSSTGRANGYSKHSGEASESHLWPVEEQMHGQAQSPAQSQTSRSTIQVPRRKISDIFQEQAPFTSQSLSSSHSQLDYAPERISSDSEEHPFEHWYRGDVARNGGVGELRVARRQEMLDIANYGHSLRNPSGKSHSGLSSRSRSNSRGRDMPNGRIRMRQRSGSVGARESIYIDDEGVAEGDTVMDERPLTDLDDDGYEDHLDDYYAQAVQPHPNGSISSPSLDIRSDTPTSRHTQNTSRSRIPQPTSRSRTTTPTPAKPTRSTSESGLASPSSPAPSPSVPRSATQPLKTQGLSPAASSPSTPSTPTAKRRAKSPANATPQSSAKKQKAKAPPSSMQKRSVARNEENRRSIGQYPLPDGGEDAIPTWTQPRPANGNWDDVVLPAVAKKKGLQDQYETADGTPKPKEPEPVVIEPAPGTFGYDPTKYRRRWSNRPEQIPMDEFGQPKTQTPPTEDVSVPVPEEHLMPTTPTVPTTPRSFDRSRIESPPPFAHYQTGGQELLPPLHMQMEASHQMSPLGGKEQPPQQPLTADEEDSGGCCKCVIM
ncbi:hypothetical protein BD311DRAFT_780297 [Dichomitus squalens]|uniref:Uncharacterized protein n=1 Tax=Dichomitus squalens TaxID=114155 RepID=A0A4Q9MG34_9APHY|nr:hypothetical protein BD311DRAFT_780297 [Dichomitus squalens]